MLAVATFETEDEAVQLANDSEYGLAGAVISSDAERCRRVAEALECGIVWVNCSQPCFCQVRRVEGMIHHTPDCLTELWICSLFYAMSEAFITLISAAATKDSGIACADDPVCDVYGCEPTRSTLQQTASQPKLLLCRVMIMQLEKLLSIHRYARHVSA